MRLILAGLFLSAGIIKLQNPEVFAVTIRAFGILPEAVIDPFSVLLPVVEVAAALGLIFDTRGALFIIGGLLALFIAILLYAIRLGLDIDCGCYGPGDPEAEAFSGIRTSLYRDMLMAAGVIYLYVWRFLNKEKPVAFWRLLRKKLIKIKEYGECVS